MSHLVWCGFGTRRVGGWCQLVFVDTELGVFFLFLLPMWWQVPSSYPSPTTWQKRNKRFLEIENLSDSEQKLIELLGVAFEGAVS